jgi:hypothetical protein
VKDAAGVRELPSEELLDLKSSFENYLPAKVTCPGEAVVIGRSLVNGRDSWAVRIHGAESQPQALYFDIQSGLLLRKRVELRSILGDAPEETDFLDYRRVGSTTLPFKIVVSTLTSKYERIFDSITTNTPIDKSRFEKPQP